MLVFGVFSGLDDWIRTSDPLTTSLVQTRVTRGQRKDYYYRVKLRVPLTDTVQLMVDHVPERLALENVAVTEYEQ